jgi:predicted O-methyltransferase YrrM
MDVTRTIDDMMRSIRSFQESRVFLTALELDVFTAVGGGADASRVASAIGTDARATEMLLNALTSLGALEKSDGIFKCTPESRALGPARAGLMHTVHLWDTWSTLTDCVKSGTTQRKVGADVRDESRTEAFIEAMHTRAKATATQVVQAVGTEGVRRMLDVGGGPGTYSMAFAQAKVDLQAEVLDLGPVVDIAQRNILQAGLSDRVTVRAGDLRIDKFGEGYDLVLVSAICHMLDEDENRDLLRRCSRSLVPGGRVVIREFILDPDRAGPPFAAIFALNMLVGTRRGNSYTEAEYRQWLMDAGCEQVTRPDPKGELIIGRRT